MRPLSLAVMVLGLWGGAASPSAQSQDVPVPILTAETNLVTLPVTVVDRRGTLITGLARGHFTVYDNGDKQDIQVFTSEDLPVTIGLLIDSSGSMRGRRAVVTAAAGAFAAMRHSLDEFFTVNFNEAVWPGLPPAVTFTGDMEELEAALAAAPAQGMTALYDALDRALDHLELATHDRKALIVVSDGGDNASRRTLDEVLERARRTNVVIHSVTFIDPDDRDARPGVLKRLARETGGHAFTPRRNDDVMHAFTRIAAEIRAGYTIGFTPPETPAAGFRSIRVEADAGDGRRLIARTRAGYYVGSSPTAR